MYRLGAAIAAMFIAAPAVAEPLSTLWTLEPVERAPATVTYGQRFFEQRLLPIKLVKITAPVAGPPAGTFLYLVYTARHQIGWCTFKDRSASNAAKSLFIPALDKRPCFLDRDHDGRLDATFSVFDKYGSMATPSGNPGDAIPLPQPVPFQSANPHSAPEAMRIAFQLSGSSDPAKVRVTVMLTKNSRNRWDALVGNTPRQANILRVLNAQLTVHSVISKQAAITVYAEPDALVTGSSGGVLATTERPAFLR